MGQVTDPSILSQLNSPAPSPPPRGAPQPVVSVPNEDQAHDNTVQDVQLGNDNTRTTLAVEGNNRAEVQLQRGSADKLRDDYNHDPDVREYHAGVKLIHTGLNTADDGQGDLTLIYAYAKMMDPTTGVREGEMENVSSSSPWVEAKVQQLKGQLDGSGRLPASVRSGLRNEMIRRGQGMRIAYSRVRGRYQQNAQTYGIDPMLVIGPDAGEGFRQSFVAYDNAHGGPHAQGQQPGGSGAPGGGANMPEMRGGLPVGTDITFDGKPDQIFDRDQYLLDNYHITSDQELWLIAFWNANRGNKNLTSDDVRRSYTSAGITHLPDEAEIQGLIKKAQSGVTFVPVDTTAARDARVNELRRMQRVMQAAGLDSTPGSVSGYEDRMGDGATLRFGDEIRGVAGAIGTAMGGGNPIDGYRDARDLERLNQQDRQDQQGWLGTGAEIVGSIPTAMVLPGGQSNTVRGIAANGAMLGGLQGFGDGNGFGDSLRSGVIGAGVGGATGFAVGKGVGKVSDWMEEQAARKAAEAADAGAAPVDAPVAPTEADLGKMAREATGWGPKATRAQDNLAGQFTPDPEAAASAARLGLDVPPDVLANNQQAQSLAGLTRSQVGSEAEAAWKAEAARIAQYADQALSDLGGTPDLAQVSDDVLTRLNATADALQNKAGALRDEVTAAISPSARVEAPNIQKVLGQTINDYGGLAEAKAAMTGPEKQLLAMLGEGEAANMPTYARIDRMRRDIGEARTKGTGPWADVNSAQLGQYYTALKADQLAAVRQIGGDMMAEKQVAANALFEKMYSQREQMQDLFGKSLEKSLAPLLRRAVTQGGKGDATALTTALDRLPQDMRGSAMVSALMAQSRSGAAHGGFSFANFAKVYLGLRQNGPVFRKMAQAIGPQGTKVLNDLHVIATRMAEAETRVLKTGKANQALMSAMQADGLLNSIMGAAGSRAATGVGAGVGGMVGGAPGAAAGATLAESAKNAIAGGGKARLDRLHDLLSSAEFKETIARIARGEDAAAASSGLWNSMSFHRLGRSLGLLTPKQRRAWLNQITSTGIVTSGAVRELPEQIGSLVQGGSQRVAAQTTSPGQSSDTNTTPVVQQ